MAPLMRRGLPFNACIPNAETLAALREIEAHGGEIAMFTTEIALSSEEQAGEAFDDYMAATLDMSEPDAGSWAEVKARLGL